MDNLILIFIGVGGVALEAYFARRERRLIAGRYLDELEDEGKIIQHGKTGQSVFYTFKQ